MSKNKIIGIVSLLLAVVGIIVVFAYRAWLGGAFILLAGIIGDYALRSAVKERTGNEYPNYVVALISEKKVGLPQYVTDGMKSGDIIEKILSIYIAILPILLAACVILWITWDTSRWADDVYSDYDIDY